MAAQFPEPAELAITAAPSVGTVNAVYRLGDRLYARLPRMTQWARNPDKEVPWLATLSRGLSPRVPAPVGRGRPAAPSPSRGRSRVWIHADLLRPKRLVHDGRLRAVIDFGGAGVGDPATDVIRRMERVRRDRA